MFRFHEGEVHKREMIKADCLEKSGYHDDAINLEVTQSGLTETLQFQCWLSIMKQIPHSSLICLLTVFLRLYWFIKSQPTNISILTLLTSSLSWLPLLRAKTWLQDNSLSSVGGDIYWNTRARLLLLHWQKHCQQPFATVRFPLIYIAIFTLFGSCPCNICLS